VRLVIAHARAQLVELLRLPSFIIPTLAFPSLFFLFWIAPASRSRPNVYLASYMGFAVLGIAFFQFGVGIASDRASPWELYLRTLPVRPTARFAARVLVAGIFAVAASAVVAATAVLTTNAGLSAGRWLALAAALLIGSAPFALLGIAIGYWATPRGALPAANILYLALSYAGGLWTGPGALPDVVRRFSDWLPTRQYADVLWSAAFGGVAAVHWLWLGVYAVTFGLVAAWGYRRDEGQRFS
jgi:ABC-2 type transport system permease protein